MLFRSCRGVLRLAARLVGSALERAQNRNRSGDELRVWVRHGSDHFHAKGEQSRSAIRSLESRTLEGADGTRSRHGKSYH